MRNQNIRYARARLAERGERKVYWITYTSKCGIKFNITVRAGARKLGA